MIGKVKSGSCMWDVCVQNGTGLRLIRLILRAECSLTAEEGRFIRNNRTVRVPCHAALERMPFHHHSCTGTPIISNKLHNTQFQMPRGGDTQCGGVYLQDEWRAWFELQDTSGAQRLKDGVGVVVEGLVDHQHWLHVVHVEPDLVWPASELRKAFLWGCHRRCRADHHRVVVDLAELQKEEPVNADTQWSSRSQITQLGRAVVSLLRRLW